MRVQADGARLHDVLRAQRAQAMLEGALQIALMQEADELAIGEHRPAGMSDAAQAPGELVQARGGGEGLHVAARHELRDAAGLVGRQGGVAQRRVLQGGAGV